MEEKLRCTCDEPSLVKSVTLVAGIVLFRFRLLPKCWAVWVVFVNALGLAFLPRIEAAVSVVGVMVGLGIITWIHKHIGFVRALGVGHSVWLVTLPWIAVRLPDLSGETALYLLWIKVMLVTNTCCLVVDSVDAIRYLRGDREPHYTW